MKSLLRTLGVCCLFAAPLEALAQAEFRLCQKHWTGLVCADEITVTSEIFSADSSGGPPATFLHVARGERVDLEIEASTFSGESAGVTVIDLQKLFEINDDAFRLAGLYLKHCGKVTSSECQATLNEINEKIPQHDIEAASLWGHACKGAKALKNKLIADLDGERSFLVAAFAGKESSASISVRVIYRTRQPGATLVCGKMQSGEILLPGGSYQHESVGTALVDVVARAGGPLQNIRLVASSPLALGTFALSATVANQRANVHFTGQLKDCRSWAEILAEILAGLRIDTHSRPDR